MSDSLHPVCGGAPVPADESPDAAFDALSNRRRRAVLAVLADRRGSIPEADLVSRVIAREAGKPSQAVGDEERRRVRGSLHHVHLPKLADAGLVALDDSDDREDRAVSATGHPLYDASEFDAVLRRGETDPAATDAALTALADGRRRAMLSVLADAGRLTETELAERVAGDDAVGENGSASVPDASAGVPDFSGDSTDGTARLLASFRHVHLPVLVRAGFATHDPEARVVVYEGHPAIEDRWFDRPFGRSSPATVGRDGDVWTLDDREDVLDRSRRVCESAADELVVVVPPDDDLDEARLARLAAAADRGVDVFFGARSPADRSLVRERVPDATVWEPRLDPVSGGETLGRTVVADGKSVVLGSLAAEDSADDRTETGLTGEGADNPLMTVVEQLFERQRDGPTGTAFDGGPG